MTIAILTPILTIDTAIAQQSYPITSLGGPLAIQNDGSNDVRINEQAGIGATVQGLYPSELVRLD